MGRMPRNALTDGLFHAYARGTGPMVIYSDSADYETFTAMLRSTIRRFEWRLLAYCLMPTHYHVVLDAQLDALSRGMHRLNGSYAHYFNRRHHRSGHLFGDRFGARLIEDDAYVERLLAYVTANPVRAGHCDTPSDWPWSWSTYDDS
jgi:REP element-mobilizing transposase RayT